MLMAITQQPTALMLVNGGIQYSPVNIQYTNAKSVQKSDLFENDHLCFISRYPDP